MFYCDHPQVWWDVTCVRGQWGEIMLFQVLSAEKVWGHWSLPRCPGVTRVMCNVPLLQRPASSFTAFMRIQFIRLGPSITDTEETGRGLCELWCVSKEYVDFLCIFSIQQTIRGSFVWKQENVFAATTIFSWRNMTEEYSQWSVCLQTVIQPQLKPLDIRNSLPPSESG